MNLEKTYQGTGKERSIGKIVMIALMIPLFIVLILAIASAILGRWKGRLPDLFGYSIYMVSPLEKSENAKDRTAIMVHTVSSKELAAGDMVAYEELIETGHPIETGRILSVETIGGKQAFQVLTSSEEEPILRYDTDIIGKVEYELPFLGTFFDFTRTTSGLAVCIAVPLALLLLIEVINLIHLSKVARKDIVFPEDGFLEEDEEEEYSPVMEATSSKESPYMEKRHKGQVSSKILGAPPEIYNEEYDDTYKQEVFEQELDYDELVSSEELILEGQKVKPFQENRKPAEISSKKFALNFEPEMIPLVVEKKEKLPAYQRPEIREQLASLHTTQEFSVKTLSSDPKIQNIHPVNSVQTVEKLLRPNQKIEFSGMKVELKPEEFCLSLEQMASPKRISLSFSGEMAHITVGSEKEEYLFSFIRDQLDQSKVTIQKRVP